MSASISKTILIGNLGRDPDMRAYPDGTPVANLNIATTETWKDKNSGERMEHTEWHRVVIDRGLAEVVGEFGRKGQLVYIEGKNKTRKWTDGDGVERYVTEIRANVFRILKDPEGAEKGAGKASKPGKSSGDTPLPPIVPPGAPMDEMDDDIPF
ncbi:single-stranded DNA-binding protein (plasmid) [Sphaerotilaceae bacterium SBD11-9]